MADIDPVGSGERIELGTAGEFDLGGTKVKPAECAIIANGERRELQPRVMQVLVALAKARPRVVSRDRLVQLCWGGRIVGDDAVNRCILALRHLAADLMPPPFRIETISRVGHRLVENPAPAEAATTRARPRRLVGMAGMLLLLATGAVLLAMVIVQRGEKRNAPTVLVRTRVNDPAARELADDLAAKLASLQTARAASMRLIDDSGDGRVRADFVLELGALSHAGSTGADLVLKAGRDGAILWSEELEQPSSNLADLRQQVAFTAARVLGCASEASETDRRRLNQQSLKLYLNGCAALTDLAGADAESVIPMFEAVLAHEPGFEGAWRKLLEADTEVFESDETEQAEARLKSDLAAATRVNPNFPERYTAAITLLPANAYADKMRLADRVVDLNPDSAEAYATRAEVLQLVGRMNDSIADARRAMQLDPLSPTARNDYILALAAAGFTSTARDELQTSERLWPGASSVAATRFAVDLRYGDPRQALAYIQANPSANWMNAKSYLEARINPSPEKIAKAIEDAQRSYRASGESISNLMQVYGDFRRDQELLRFLLGLPRSRLAYVDVTFRAPVVHFWRDPRALIVAKRVGLLQYWRTSGHWPDFCYTADLPYDCRAEAGKIAG
jgi:DNA-binding winged helix-turn-helix (wHTH) protein/tetratricopeptide (TPR) repeat protein